MDEQIEYLLSLTPEGFEGLIRDWLCSLGWHAVTTVRTGDGGVDVRAVNPDPLSGGKVVVQCKRYSRGNPVGAPTVREFYGVVTHEGAARGLLVTTSSFTKDGEAFADGKPLSLLDGAQTCRLLGEAGLLDVPEDALGQVPDAGASDRLDYAEELLEDDPAEAERIALQVIKSGPPSAKAWVCLAQARRQRNLLRQAKSAYLRAFPYVDSVLDETCTLESLGSLALRMGYADERPLERLAEAERFLQLAAARSPFPNGDAAWWLLKVYLRWYEQVQFARDVTAQDAGCLDQAVPCLRYGQLAASLVFDPAPPGGRQFIARSDFDDAMTEWWEQEQGRYVTWDGAERRVATKRDQCLAAAKAALSARSWEVASDNLEYASRAAPEEAHWWRWLGYASVQAGRLYPAVRAYAVYLALAPEADDASQVEDYLRRAYDEVERTWKPLDPSELGALGGS